MNIPALILMLLILEALTAGSMLGLIKTKLKQRKLKSLKTQLFEAREVQWLQFISTEIEINYKCLECNTKKWTKVRRRRSVLVKIFWQDRFVECTCCGTRNDVWQYKLPIRHLFIKLTNYYGI